MNLNEEKLDDIFREKLEGFTKAPSPESWENIRLQLISKRKKGRILIYRVLAVAAVLALAMIAGWVFYGHQTLQPNQPLVEKAIPKTPPSRPETPESNTESIKENQNVATARTDKSKNKMGNRPSVNYYTATSEKQEALKSSTLTEAESRDNCKIQKFSFLTPQKIPVPEKAVHEKLRGVDQKLSINNPMLTEKDKKLIAMNASQSVGKNRPARWSLGLNISPGYSSENYSHTESYSRSMTYSVSNGDEDINGGIIIGYKVSNRWSLESGVNYSQNSQQSGYSPLPPSGSSVAAVPGFYGPDYSNSPLTNNLGILNMNSIAGIIQISKTSANTELLTQMDARYNTSGSIQTESKFTQVFDFVEIPLLMKYKLIDRKMGVEFAGGVSANWLIGNKAYMEVNNSREDIGKTLDISAFNYSGILGAGISYELGKNLIVSMEPRFNYYLNSINKNSGIDYHPYRIGIYTGVNYRF